MNAKTCAPTIHSILLKLTDGTTVFAHNADVGGIEYDVWTPVAIGEPTDGGFADDIESVEDIAQNEPLLTDLIGNIIPWGVSAKQVVCILYNEDAEEVREIIVNQII